MLTAILLGFIQGIAEWIPVSSEGAVAAAYSALEGGTLEEAVGYALWLHIGTVPAAVIALRREIWGLVMEVRGIVSINRASPIRSAARTGSRRQIDSGQGEPAQGLSPLFRYLVVSTLVSGVIGLPLLLALSEVTGVAGASVMLAVGVAMLVTGYVLLRQRVVGDRDRGELSMMDAVIGGMAQGVSALPGISRSGMTMAALLGRRLDRQEAVIISFLMSIPASLGAVLFAVMDDGVDINRESLVGAAVAFVVGLATIKVLLAVARRVNFGVFVLAVGTLLIVGGVVQVGTG